VSALRIEILDSAKAAEIKEAAFGQGKLESALTPEERQACEQKATARFEALVSNFPRKWVAPKESKTAGAVLPA
jgi:hypothetical protein